MAGRDPEDKNPEDAPEVCGALGCGSTDDIELVDDGNGRVRALCPMCAKHFIGVTT